MNYTYIVKCSDGTFYTGWTNDLTRRMEAHNQAGVRSIQRRDDRSHSSIMRHLKQKKKR
mgnify:CR=1 FL=1